MFSHVCDVWKLDAVYQGKRIHVTQGVYWCHILHRHICQLMRDTKINADRDSEGQLRTSEENIQGVGQAFNFPLQSLYVHPVCLCAYVTLRDQAS